MTILLFWLMFAMFAVLAFTLNVGQMFLYHAHLQTSTDCAAFSGAVQQARGLNMIAAINNRVIELLGHYQRSVRSRTHSSFGAGRRAANSAANNFRISNSTLLNRQDSTNKRYCNNAIAEARNIAMRNQGGLPSVDCDVFLSQDGQLTTLRRVRARSVNFSFRYYEWYWKYLGMGRYRRARRVRSSAGPRVQAIVSQKETSDLTYFCLRLERQSRQFLTTWGGLLPEYFGPIKTYATAMPFAGFLWDGSGGRTRYDAKLVRTGAVHPVPLVPDKWAKDW